MRSSKFLTVVVMAATFLSEPLMAQSGKDLPGLPVQDLHITHSDTQLRGYVCQRHLLDRSILSLGQSSQSDHDKEFRKTRSCHRPGFKIRRHSRPVRP